MSAFTALNGTSPKTSQPPPTQPAEGAPAEPDSRTQVPAQPPSTDATPSAAAPADSWSRPPPERPTSHYTQPGRGEWEGSHKRKRSNSPDPPRREFPPMQEQRNPEGAHNNNNNNTATSHVLQQQHHPADARDYRPASAAAAAPPDDRRERAGSWYSQQGQQDHGSESPAVGPNDDTDVDHDYSRTSPDGDTSMMTDGFNGPFTPEQRRESGLQSDPKKRKRNFSNRTKTGCLTCRRRKKKCDEKKPECVNCSRGGFICQGYPPHRGAPGWSKPDSKSATVPLESKDPNYVPPGAYGMPHQVSSISASTVATPTTPSATSSLPPPPITVMAASSPNIIPTKRDPATSSYRGQPLRIDPPQGRSIQNEDDRPTATTLPSAVSTTMSNNTSPDLRLSAISSAYTQGTSVFPTPVSAHTVPPPFSKEYQRVPPLHDLTRTDPDTPHTATEPLPRISVFRPSATSSPAMSSHMQHQPPPQQQQQQQQQQPPPPVQMQAPTPTAQEAAKMALSHPHFPENRLSEASKMNDPRSHYADTRMVRSAKDDMLSGRHYFSFDKELVWERERTSAACWRFNNAMNPNLGIAPHERMRLFREIVLPRDPSPFHTGNSRIGYLGEAVSVDAPFTCDYGYNLIIGHNVVISKNCTIMDPCEVKIGDNCQIGPNVSIYGTTLPIDYVKRRERTSSLGMPVTIESDCWIGGGVTILAGIIIGKGSTIGAGSVVTKNVPPFTIAAGNPARILRGIPRDSD